MILLFGGTTEGRNMAALLDTIGEDYFYSTKAENRHVVGGTVISGEMDKDRIITFCRENNIRLIIDGAHPFAVSLHQNIHRAAVSLSIMTMRFERPRLSFEEDAKVRFFDSYPDLEIAVLDARFQNILALTGVQTIARLPRLWQERKCYFRILDTPASYEKARETGISEKLIIPMAADGDVQKLNKLVHSLNAEVLLSKESGDSGFLASKAEAACQSDIPLWIVRAPVLPDFDYVVTSEKAFLKRLYLLKKTVWQPADSLRPGFTTGSCVTAAASASLLALVRGEFPGRVTVHLPNEEQAQFPVFSGHLSGDSASCVVIKDAGDDPDVTHAREIGCKLTRSPYPGVHFHRGTGIGQVTMPGLQVDVGEPAINPVPRAMIAGELEQLARQYEEPLAFEVEPFVPGGEALARQTFNPRVGVKGGISVLGTSGRVWPFSHEAFVASLEQQLSVAASYGCREEVLTSGKRSEKRVRSHLDQLPSTAMIHFGNLIGVTLEKVCHYGFSTIHLVVRLGKGVKLAAGNLDTHSRKVSFDPEFLAGLAAKSGCPSHVVTQIKALKLANAVVKLLPFVDYDFFYQSMARECYSVCKPLLPDGAHLKLWFLVDEENLVVVP